MLTSLVLLLLSSPSLSSYLHVDLLSTEACDQDGDPLHLDPGAAAVLSLESEYRSTVYKSFFKCDLEIRASPGYGLMVRVEEGVLGHVRRDGGRCTDFLQLGRGDNVPFFTVEKSDELCGEDLSQFSYDVNNGQLLVWLRLNGRADSRLSLVATSYFLNKFLEEPALAHPSLDLENTNNFSVCNDGRRWVRKEYFCDGRVNCATDESEPADEAEVHCATKELEKGEAGSGLDNSPTKLPGHPLNLISITLVLVCGAIMISSLLLLVARLRRVRRCCWGRETGRGVGDCELPDRSRQVVQVGDHQQQLQPRRPELVMSSEQQLHLQPSLTTALVTRGTTPDTEPPPAYHDLFPSGYQFSPQKEEVVEEVVEEEVEEGGDKEETSQANSSQVRSDI